MPVAPARVLRTLPWVVPLLALALTLPGVLATPTSGAPPPPLPSPESAGLLELSTPTTTPGTSVTVGLTVTNDLGTPIDNASLQVAFYRFDVNGATQGLSPGDAWAPTFSGTLALPSGVQGRGEGLSGNFTLPSLPPAGTVRLTLPVAVPASAPAGSYLLRDRLLVNTTQAEYLFASRGYFPDALWARATLTGNGTPILNLTLLGVSGVVPESALGVVSPWVTPILLGILGTALAVAAAVGVHLVRQRRRPPKHQSSSGASGEPDRNQAPRAFGK